MLYIKVFMESKYMKILIIRLSSLGDIVLTEPITRALAKFYPQAEISYLVKPAFRDIVAFFPTQVTIIEWGNNFSSLLSLSKTKYDLLIDLHNKPNTALIRMFCQASTKIVYDKKHHLRHQIVAHKTSQTISSTLDLYFSALKKLKLKPTSLQPLLIADDSAETLLQNAKLVLDEYILIFPGATSYTKRWQIDSFSELIDLISPKFQVVIAGGKNEMELANYLINKCNSNIIDFTGKTKLPQLISLIAKAKAVIANDSGPAHLAAALQKPQITIFGATSPSLGFAPLNKKGIIISQNLSCSPCSLHGSNSCPKNHFNCMNQITPATIQKALTKIL